LIVFRAAVPPLQAHISPVGPVEEVGAVTAVLPPVPVHAPANAPAEKMLETRPTKSIFFI
jgi:hypothetical protein